VTSQFLVSLDSVQPFPVMVRVYHVALFPFIILPDLDQPYPFSDERIYLVEIGGSKQGFPDILIGCFSSGFYS
jgi:hypothetical protein